jgi:hypothetical protein
VCRRRNTGTPTIYIQALSVRQTRRMAAAALRGCCLLAAKM